MKKILSLFTLLVIILSSAACGTEITDTQEKTEAPVSGSTDVMGTHTENINETPNPTQPEK